MVEVISSGIQPIQNLSVLQHIGRLVGEEKAAAEKQEWGRHYIAKGFDGNNKSYISTLISKK